MRSTGGALCARKATTLRRDTGRMLRLRPSLSRDERASTRTDLLVRHLGRIAVHGKMMMRSTLLLIAAWMLGLAPAIGQHRLGGTSIDGSVVRIHGCGNHFFIVYGTEYALVEWLGGDMVMENDRLEVTDDQGSFEREGRLNLKNTATGRPVDVVIEKTLMNASDYSKTVASVCR
jgi:hypothetical protein